MGKPIGDEPCPSCRSVSRDTTGNHLMIFEDGGKHCKRCKYTVTSLGTIIESGHLPSNSQVSFKDLERLASATLEPVKQKKKKHTIQEIQERTAGGVERYRNIPKNIADEYGLRGSYNETNRALEQVAYPVYQEGKLKFYKFRRLPKDIYCLGRTKREHYDLFGENTCLTNHFDIVLITEGEDDAMTAKWMLTKYPGVTCVSLLDGADSKISETTLKKLKKAKEVVLCLDQDKDGKRATERIWSLIPTAKVMTFSEKDACDMKAKGKEDEFRKAFDNRQIHRPKSLVKIDESFIKQVAAPVKWGLTYPYKELTECTYGMMEGGAIIGVGAGPGAGKTTFVKALQQHLIYTHKEPIGIFSLEETPVESMKYLSGYIKGLPIHLPDCRYNPKDIIDIAKDVAPMVYIYDPMEYRDWPDVEMAFRWFSSLGVKYFFIDPMSALVADLSSSEANDYLGRAMSSLRKLRIQLGITIFHINHLNNPQNGKDHGAGGRVYAGQFAGSKAMWRYSTDLWGLERDQLAQDGTENIVTWRNLKARIAATTGRTFQLEYNRATGRLSPIIASRGGF